MKSPVSCLMDLSMTAGLVMSIAPILIFYLLCQKQILAGVVQGSVKG